MVGRDTEEENKASSEQGNEVASRFECLRNVSALALSLIRALVS